MISLRLNSTLEGVLTPVDILNVKGPMKVQEYIVNEIQEVYRSRCED